MRDQAVEPAPLRFDFRHTESAPAFMEPNSAANIVRADGPFNLHTRIRAWTPWSIYEVISSATAYQETGPENSIESSCIAFNTSELSAESAFSSRGNLNLHCPMSKEGTIIPQTDLCPCSVQPIQPSFCSVPSLPLIQLII